MSRPNAQAVGPGASDTQLKDLAPIIESRSETQEQESILQDSKEEDKMKGNDYEERFGKLTKSLSEKEKEVSDLKVKLKANKSILEKRLKRKDNECTKLEVAKLQLERELSTAKEEVKLLNERLNNSKEEELKEKISELEKEVNKKVEEFQKKDAKIKHREDQVYVKEKSVFDAEGSDAADKRDRELMIKQVEDLKKESEKNIAEATRRIDELEGAHKEQRKEINRLREENTVLKGTIEEQGNMRERLTELEALFDKVAASHEEEMNHIRRKEETKRVELEEKWKRKFDDESQQRTQSHLKEMNEGMEAARKKYKDRLQAREEELQAQLDQEKKKLEKQVQDILAKKDKEIKEISERLALKETENDIFKQDFKIERNDRERIKGQLILLQAQEENLKQEAAEKEKEAQMKFHNLKQSNSTLERDLEESRKEIATKGAEIASLGQKNAQLEKQHAEEIKKMKKKLKDSETGETDKMKEMEEEIQVLTAQVNAYSREVEKQKGLVTQSQEKHKTEVNELNERLANEIKSKQQLNNELAKIRQQLDSVTKKHETETAELQEKSKQKVQQFQQMIKEKLENEKKSEEQLDNELARMRQQLANVSANNEELLAAYDQERAIVTKLKNDVETTKQANTVLKDKLLHLQQLQTPSAAPHIQLPAPHNVGGFQHVSHPLPTRISTRQNFESSAQIPSGPKQVVQRDGDGVLIVPKTEQTTTPVLHTDSNPDDTPQMSKEEMTKMFKWHDQQESPQQVEDSLVKEEKRKEIAMKADDAVLEVERLRESRLNVKKESSISTKKTLPPSQQTLSKQKAKPKVKKDQAKQEASDDSESDIEENKLIDNIDEEIQQMAEDVRKGSRGPTTAEVLFDDGDSSLPYDPNLVCPKCGKQYRVGEIQKLRRHMNEFCTGIR